MPNVPALFPEVYEGGNGDLVICQEWPNASGEQYLRVIVPMVDAKKLADAIVATVTLAAAKDALGDANT